MVPPPDNLWAQLSSASLYTGIVPIVLGGGLAILKPWITSVDDIRNRVNLRKVVLREAINRRLYDLLSKAVLELDPKKLRIASAAEPDIVDDYTTEVFRVFTVLQELQQIASNT